jgi:N-methylhydantoinase A
VHSHELAAGDVPQILEQFNAQHRQTYGHAMDDPVEIVTVRLRAVGVLPRPELPKIAAGTGDSGAARIGSRQVFSGERDAHVEYAVYDRTKLGAGDTLPGPAIVEESTSTTVLHENDVLTVGEYGELIIQTA